jgi:Ni/Co efflux regulator RcnB
MRAVAAAIAAVLWLILAGPAATQWSGPDSAARPGKAGGTPWVTRRQEPLAGRHEFRRRDVRRHDGVLRDGGRIEERDAKRRDAKRRDAKRHDDGRRDRRDAKRHDRFHHLVPRFRVYRADREPEPAPPAPPAPPEVAAPPEPAPPPDPRGPLWLTPARGAAPEAERWQLGEALPPGLPHVTLDWRLHGLPAPPPGRIYVRVGRDVLLITAGERVVELVVPSG